MGMFDYVRCQYPLPVDGANALVYQTKDTASQCLKCYEIRSDGTLWRQDYDIEYSRASKAEPGSLESTVVRMTRTNERWEQEIHNGAVEIYTGFNGGWLEFCAVFRDGDLQSLTVLSEPTNAKDERPQKAAPKQE